MDERCLLEGEGTDSGHGRAGVRIRRNIRNLEKAGVTFDDERKLGYIAYFSMMETDKLLARFATSRPQVARSTMMTVLSVLNKCLLEKMEAEDAVFGINAKEDETK